MGTCQDADNIVCEDELDCPQWGDKGKCAATGDACNGPCPSAKTCNQTGESCEDTVPCPKNRTKGYCSNSPTKSCTKSSTCGKSASCIFPLNQCTGPENFCKHPHRPCRSTRATSAWR